MALARDWQGTPYHHQASTKGVGCDCIGLIRALYREINGCEAQPMVPYTRDWCEASGREDLLEAARRHLAPVNLAEALPGDVLLFRFRPWMVVKHAAVLSAPGRIIHAYESAGRVVETALGSWWRRRIAGVFRF